MHKKYVEKKSEKEIRCPSWENGVWGACGAGETCISEGIGGFLFKCLCSSASDLGFFCVSCLLQYVACICFVLCRRRLLVVIASCCQGART